jgi:uncharacterized DUF497 family protein
MEFEWDDNKDAINVAKHGLSFYEARPLFSIRREPLSLTQNTRQRKRGTFA